MDPKISEAPKINTKWQIRKFQYNRDPKVSEASTQTDIANMIGISVDTLNNYKKLTELIPEIQDLVDMGIVAQSTAVAVYKNE